MDKSYGLSQYYHSEKSCVRDNLVKDTSMDDNSNVSIDDKENLDANLTKIGSSSMNGDEEQMKYSPVLKPSMFVSPTKLPGLDAVYISRLQDGDFTEINENDVDDSYEQIDDYVNKSRNPFIEYECEEGDDESFSENNISAADVEQNVNPNLSESNLKWSSNESFRTKTTKPQKRKLDYHDNTLPKIDEFLSNKIKKVSQGDVSVNKLKSKYNISDADRKPVQIKKRVNVSFNIRKCTDASPSSFNSQPGVVAPFQSGWIVKDETELLLLNPHCLREVILYNRLLCNHKIPTETLDEPMLLYPGKLSLDQANKILRMPKNQDPLHAALVSDRRITHNGFMIEHRKASPQSPDAQTFVYLVAKSTIPFYGVEELEEILNFVSDEVLDDDIKQSRPEKVKKYLSEEASRLARDMPEISDSETVNDLLRAKTDLKCSRMCCLHDKPMIKLLNTFL